MPDVKGTSLMSFSGTRNKTFPRRAGSLSTNKLYKHDK